LVSLRSLSAPTLLDQELVLCSFLFSLRLFFSPKLTDLPSSLFFSRDVARHRECFEGLEMVAVSQSFMFGVVLLINVWGGKKSGSIGDPEMA